MAAGAEQIGFRQLHRLRLHQLPLDESQHVHPARNRFALKDFVIVDLFTDGTDADSEKNQKLEDQRFGTASIPFYAILDKKQMSWPLSRSSRATRRSFLASCKPSRKW